LGAFDELLVDFTVAHAVVFGKASAQQKTRERCRAANPKYYRPPDRSEMLLLSSSVP